MALGTTLHLRARCIAERMVHVPPGVACREYQRLSQIKTVGGQYLKSSAGMACQDDLARHRLDATSLGLCWAWHACRWGEISRLVLVCWLLKRKITFGILVQDLAFRTPFHQDRHDTCALCGRGHDVASLGHPPWPQAIIAPASSGTWANWHIEICGSC